MILNKKGDLGIYLILGWPFLRDAKAKIDVGTGKISFLIMGKNMKFRFQNKEEQLYLIHEDNKGQGLRAEPGWEDWEIHYPSTKLAWEVWEIHNLTPEDSSPTPPTTPKKTKNVCHKKRMLTSSTTSPGNDESTSTWSGMEKSLAHWIQNQELAWGRFPPLSQLYPFIFFQ